MIVAFVLLFFVTPVASFKPLSLSELKPAVEDWFVNATAAEALYGSISDWDVTSVVSMDRLFHGRDMTGIDISEWRTDSLRTADFMFGDDANPSTYASGFCNWDVTRVLDLDKLLSGLNVENMRFCDPSWMRGDLYLHNMMYENAACGLCEGETPYSLGMRYHDFVKSGFGEKFVATDANIRSAVASTIFGRSDGTWSHPNHGPIGEWDTSAVTDMSNLFQYQQDFCADISAWDTSSVTDMSGMFQGTQKFDMYLDWDTSKVRNMRNMFADSAFSHGLAWDVSSVEDMTNMFPSSYESFVSWDQNDVRYAFSPLSFAYSSHGMVDAEFLSHMYGGEMVYDDVKLSLGKDAYVPSSSACSGGLFPADRAEAKTWGLPVAYKSRRGHVTGAVEQVLSKDGMAEGTGISVGITKADRLEECEMACLYRSSIYTNDDGDCFCSSSVALVSVKPYKRTSLSDGFFCRPRASVETLVSDVDACAEECLHPESSDDASFRTHAFWKQSVALSFMIEAVGGTTEKLCTCLPNKWDACGTDESEFTTTGQASMLQKRSGVTTYDIDVSLWLQEYVYAPHVCKTCDTNCDFEPMVDFTAESEFPFLVHTVLGTATDYVYRKCPDGYEWRESVCVRCDPNTYWVRGRCLECPHGTSSGAGALRCMSILTDYNIREAVEQIFSAMPVRSDFQDELSYLNAVRRFSNPHNYFGEVEKWDTSRVTDMSRLFKGRVFDRDISGWDVSRVEDMTEMFLDSTFSGDLRAWNVARVKKFDRMFSGTNVKVWHGWVEQDGTGVPRTYEMRSSDCDAVGYRHITSVEECRGAHTALARTGEFTRVSLQPEINDRVCYSTHDAVFPLDEKYVGMRCSSACGHSGTVSVITRRQGHSCYCRECMETSHIPVAPMPFRFVEPAGWCSEFSFDNLQDASTVEDCLDTCRDAGKSVAFFKDGQCQCLEYDGTCENRWSLNSDFTFLTTRKEITVEYVPVSANGAEKFDLRMNGYIGSNALLDGVASVSKCSYRVKNGNNFVSPVTEFVSSSACDAETPCVCVKVPPFQYVEGCDGPYRSILTMDECEWAITNIGDTFSLTNLRDDGCFSGIGKEVCALESVYDVSPCTEGNDVPECHMNGLRCLAGSDVEFGTCFFTDRNIHAAVRAWSVSPRGFERLYGRLSDWDVSRVVDMTSLFEDSDMNPDIRNWDVRSVGVIDRMFKNSNFNYPIDGLQFSALSSAVEAFEGSSFSHRACGMNFVRAGAKVAGSVKGANGLNNCIVDSSIRGAVVNWFGSMQLSFSGGDVLVNGHLARSLDFELIKNAPIQVTSPIPAKFEVFGDMSMNFTFSPESGNYDILSNRLVANGEDVFHAVLQRDGHREYGYISDWDVSEVTDMSYLFFGRNITFSLSSWNTENVVTMKGMFEGADYDEDIRHWDVSSVETFAFMFKDSTFGQDLTRWQFTFKQHDGMFSENSNYAGNTLIVTKFLSPVFTNAMLRDAVNLWFTDRDAAVEQYKDISEWRVYQVTDMSGLFKNRDFSDDLSRWVVSSVTDMSSMFEGSTFNGDISDWQVINVESMSRMFMKSKFNSPIRYWNVTNVRNMSQMFAYSAFNKYIGDWELYATSPEKIKVGINQGCESNDYVFVPYERGSLTAQMFCFDHCNGNAMFDGLRDVEGRNRDRSSGAIGDEETENVGFTLVEDERQPHTCHCHTGACLKETDLSAERRDIRCDPSSEFIVDVYSDYDEVKEFYTFTAENDYRVMPESLDCSEISEIDYNGETLRAKKVVTNDFGYVDVNDYYAPSIDFPKGIFYLHTRKTHSQIIHSRYDGYYPKDEQWGHWASSFSKTTFKDCSYDPNYKKYTRLSSYPWYRINPYNGLRTQCRLVKTTYTYMEDCYPKGVNGCNDYYQRYVTAFHYNRVEVRTVFEPGWYFSGILPGSSPGENTCRTGKWTYALNGRCEEEGFGIFNCPPGTDTQDCTSDLCADDDFSCVCVFPPYSLQGVTTSEMAEKRPEIPRNPGLDKASRMLACLNACKDYKSVLFSEHGRCSCYTQNFNSALQSVELDEDVSCSVNDNDEYHVNYIAGRLQDGISEYSFGQIRHTAVQPLENVEFGWLNSNGFGKCAVGPDVGETVVYTADDAPEASDIGEIKPLTFTECKRLCNTTSGCKAFSHGCETLDPDAPSYQYRIKNQVAPGVDYALTLGVCEGSCNSDADCATGLKCFQRSGSEAGPSMCSGNLMNGFGYCYEPGLCERHVCTLSYVGCEAEGDYVFDDLSRRYTLRQNYLDKTEYFETQKTGARHEWEYSVIVTPVTKRLSTCQKNDGVFMTKDRCSLVCEEDFSKFTYFDDGSCECGDVCDGDGTETATVYTYGVPVVGMATETHKLYRFGNVDTSNIFEGNDAFTQSLCGVGWRYRDLSSLTDSQRYVALSCDVCDPGEHMSTCGLCIGNFEFDRCASSRAMFTKEYLEAAGGWSLQRHVWDNYRTWKPSGNLLVDQAAQWFSPNTFGFGQWIEPESEEKMILNERSLYVEVTSGTCAAVTASECRSAAVAVGWGGYNLSVPLAEIEEVHDVSLPGGCILYESTITYNENYGAECTLETPCVCKGAVRMHVRKSVQHTPATYLSNILDKCANTMETSPTAVLTACLDANNIERVADDDYSESSRWGSVSDYITFRRLQEYIAGDIESEEVGYCSDGSLKMRAECESVQWIEKCYDRCPDGVGQCLVDDYDACRAEWFGHAGDVRELRGYDLLFALTEPELMNYSNAFAKGTFASDLRMLEYMSLQTIDDSNSSVYAGVAYNVSELIAVHPDCVDVNTSLLNFTCVGVSVEIGLELDGKRIIESLPEYESGWVVGFCYGEGGNDNYHKKIIVEYETDSGDLVSRVVTGSGLNHDECLNRRFEYCTDPTIDNKNECEDVVWIPMYNRIYDIWSGREEDLMTWLPFWDDRCEEEGGTWSFKYETVTSGTCESAGMNVVPVYECAEIGVNVFGWSDELSLDTVTSLPSRPHGCVSDLTNNDYNYHEVSQVLCSASNPCVCKSKMRTCSANIEEPSVDNLCFNESWSFRSTQNAYCGGLGTCQYRGNDVPASSKSECESTRYCSDPTITTEAECLQKVCSDPTKTTENECSSVSCYKNNIVETRDEFYTDVRHGYYPCSRLNQESPGVVRTASRINDAGSCWNAIDQVFNPPRYYRESSWRSAWYPGGCYYNPKNGHAIFVRHGHKWGKNNFRRLCRVVETRTVVNKVVLLENAPLGDCDSIGVCSDPTVLTKEECESKTCSDGVSSTESECVSQYVEDRPSDACNCDPEDRDGCYVVNGRRHVRNNEAYVNGVVDFSEVDDYFCELPVIGSRRVVNRVGFGSASCSEDAELDREECALVGGEWSVGQCDKCLAPCAGVDEGLKFVSVNRECKLCSEVEPIKCAGEICAVIDNTCVLCPGGQFTNENFVGCGDCPRGTFGENGICLTCPAGRVSLSEGQSACTACPENTFSVATGCVPCELGFIAPAESSVCRETCYCWEGETVSDCGDRYGNYCESCKDGFVSRFGTCVADCVNGQFDSGTCVCNNMWQHNKTAGTTVCDVCPFPYSTMEGCTDKRCTPLYNYDCLGENEDGMLIPVLGTDRWVNNGLVSLCNELKRSDCVCEYAEGDTTVGAYVPWDAVCVNTGEKQGIFLECKAKSELEKCDSSKCPSGLSAKDAYCRGEDSVYQGKTWRQVAFREHCGGITYESADKTVDGCARECILRDVDAFFMTGSTCTCVNTSCVMHYRQVTEFSYCEREEALTFAVQDVTECGQTCFDLQHSSFYFDSRTKTCVCMNYNVSECEGDYSMKYRSSVKTYELKSGIGEDSDLRFARSGVGVFSDLYVITSALSGRCVESDYLPGSSCCSLSDVHETGSYKCTKCLGDEFRNSTCTAQVSRTGIVNGTWNPGTVVVGGREESVLSGNLIDEYVAYVQDYRIFQFDDPMSVHPLIVEVQRSEVNNDEAISERVVLVHQTSERLASVEEVNNIKFFQSVMADEYRFRRTSSETLTMEAVRLFGLAWRNGHCVPYEGHVYSVESFDECFSKCLSFDWCAGFSYDEEYSGYDLEWSDWVEYDRSTDLNERKLRVFLDWYGLDYAATTFVERVQRVVPRVVSGVCKLSNTQCKYEDEIDSNGIVKDVADVILIEKQYGVSQDDVQDQTMGVSFWKSRGAKRYAMAMQDDTSNRVALAIRRDCERSDILPGGKCCAKTAKCSDYEYTCTSGTFFDSVIEIDDEFGFAQFAKACCVTVSYEYSASECKFPRCLGCDAAGEVVTDASECAGQFGLIGSLGSMCDGVETQCLFPAASNDFPSSWKMLDGKCVYVVDGEEYTICRGVEHV